MTFLGGLVAAPAPGKAGASGRPPIYNPESLLNFWTALENRNAQRVKWMVFGNSWSTFAAVANQGGTWADGYGPVAQRQVLAQFPVTGNPPCGSWYPANIIGGTGSPVPWTLVAGAPVSQTLYGPNMANYHVSSAFTQTLTIAGTSANLWFAEDATLTGVFSWQVDAGPVTNVNVPATGLGHAVDGHLVNISLGAAGTHTITIKWVSGDLFWAGADVFDGDETVGFHIIPAGHGGWGAHEWVANDVVGSNGISQTLATVQPDLITIELGINDWGVNNRLPITFDLDMVTLIYKIQAQVPNCSIVIIAIPRSITAHAISGTWQQFLAVMKGVATQFGAGLIDLAEIFPWASAPNQQGFWWTDNGHPSLLGHHEIGPVVATGITAGFGQATLGNYPLYISNNVGTQTVAVSPSVTTLATTIVLQPGIYKLMFSLTVRPNFITATAIEAEWVVGTATASFGGSTSAEVGFHGEATGVRDVRQMVAVGNVLVTAAGTLVLQATASIATVNVLGSTDQNNFPRASGYVIEMVNTGL